MRPPPIPRCTYPIAHPYHGEPELCGVMGEYQDVTGSYCYEHWPLTSKEHWYRDGLLYGWDWRYPDPTKDL